MSDMSVPVPASLVSANQYAAALPVLKSTVDFLATEQTLKESREKNLANVLSLKDVIRAGYGKGNVPAGFVSPNTLAQKYLNENPAELKRLWTSCSAEPGKRAMRIVNNMAEKMTYWLERAGAVEVFKPDSEGAKRAAKHAAAAAADAKGEKPAARSTDKFDALTKFSIGELLSAVAARIEEASALKGEAADTATRNAATVGQWAAKRKAVVKK